MVKRRNTTKIIVLSLMVFYLGFGLIIGWYASGFGVLIGCAEGIPGKTKEEGLQAYQMCERNIKIDRYRDTLLFALIWPYFF